MWCLLSHPAWLHTTAGMSIAPFSATRSLGAWLVLPNPSHWLIWTGLGYLIQFTRRPPRFRCILGTSVEVWDAPVLCKEIAVLLVKNANRACPSSRVGVRFLQPLLHRAQKKAVGSDQSWICESWIGHFTSSHLRYWHRGTSSDASSPRIGWRVAALSSPGQTLPFYWPECP